MPAVVVVTEVFENLARTAARAQGRPAMRCCVLPHPMESRPDPEVRAIARAHFRELVTALTTPRDP